MNATEYAELAGRTSTPDATNYLERIDRTEFDRVVNGFEAASQAAERLKKQIFYGRDLPRSPTIIPATLNCRFTPTALHANLGIMGESHELVNAKTRDEVKDEAGDLLWYIAKRLKEQNLTFEEVFEFNIDKLRARFPHRFDENIAKNLDSSVHQAQ
jgi:hypothetical protein